MRYIFCMLFSLLLAFSAQAAFVAGTEDIPLMDGLKQTESDNFAFGNEDSRFVETTLTSDQISFAEAKVFYVPTLHQFGWILEEQKPSFLRFSRENEMLEMSLESSSPLQIRVTIKSVK